MSMMVADVRRAAVSHEQVLGACADGFLDGETAKLDWTSILVGIAGVCAVLALARLINLYFGGF